MVTKYAVVLRVSFVGIGATWEGAPSRDIYFKVLPLGTAQVPGCLIGFPALDSTHGAAGALGWRVMPDHHLFEGVGVALPRGELSQRERHQSETQLWRDGDSTTRRAPGVAYMTEDQVNLLRCAAREHDAAEATYQQEPFSLLPGEQALVPVVWDEPPTNDFACQVHEQAPHGLEALDGLCAGGQEQQMLCVYNGSQETVTVERGDALAEGFPVPPDVALVRRGPNPVAGSEGAEPDVICASRESVLPDVSQGELGPELGVVTPPMGRDGSSSDAAGATGTVLATGTGRLAMRPALPEL